MGAAERMNRTLLERTRCLLLNVGLDRSFWAEALNTACYLINRWPAYYHVSEGKLDPQGEKGIFMGYGDDVKGYRIWSPLERRVILTRDVTFDEDYLFHMKQDPTELELEEGASEKVEHVAKQVEYVEHEVPEDTDHDVTLLDPPAHLEHEQYRSIALDRPRRDAKAPSRLGFQNYVAYALQVAKEVESLEPATYREAITLKDSDMWITAMGEEINSPHKNNTWELVKLPERRKVVGCKCVFKMKTGLPGSDIIKFKACLVVKGYSQKEGIDYNEIFSPVVRHTSIRVLLSLVSHHDLKLEQLEVKTAFLHGDLEEEIYMSQPEGFIVQGKEDYILEVLMIVASIIKKAPSGSLIYLLLYVDDMLVAAIDMEEVKKLKILLNTYIDMKDLGAARKITGKEIIRDQKHVKRVFHYLKGTSDVGLIYYGEHEYMVAGYSDLDYDADLDARRSLTVALSTTEAGYMALTEAAKEGIWLKGLIEDLGFLKDQATVFCDSMSAICLAKDQVYHDRTKHIDVRYHFIRTKRIIKVKKIGTQDNHADVLTKQIPLNKLRHCLDLVNIDNWKCGVT
ncbi:retrovirus-related pol polyprotein from transposon TNT 1-94 [Tanacetum coccineum]